MLESPTPLVNGSPAANCSCIVEPILEVRGLSVRSKKRELLRSVDLAVAPCEVFGIIGPSGAGKSTLLKCLNRLIELTPGLQIAGEVRFHGESIYAADVDVDSLRARIGIIFQQPVVFPQSILQNVLFGTRHLGKASKKDWPEIAERALREAALWNEVKDRLHESALRMSVGQQQRLCLARTLAVDPEVILMDEPTSALDPRSTEAIEELILQLKAKRPIVIVTHNLRQARAVADRVACLAERNGAGELVTCGACAEVLGGAESEDVTRYFESGARSRAAV